MEEPHRYIAACVEVNPFGGFDSVGQIFFKLERFDCVHASFQTGLGLATGPTACMIVMFVVYFITAEKGTSSAPLRV